MLNEKILSILIRVYLVVVALWGIWHLYTRLTGSETWTIGAVIAVLVAIGIIVPATFLALRFTEATFEERRIIQLFMVIVFCFSLGLAYSASTTLEHGRTLSGLRVSQLTVNVVMSAVLHLGLVVAVEMLWKFKRMPAVLKQLVT